MNIVPLTKENLEETIAMAHEVFPLDAVSKNPPEKGLRKSLSFDTEDSSWNSITKGKKLTRLNYWVLLDDDTNKVIGVTGLYAFSDAVDEAWLAWFCLDGSTRGKGLGRKLLEWTMNKAKEEGYKVFRLYTSTDPNEAAAQKLYESIGLKVINEEVDADSPYKILYRQVQL
jgi:GNAT superfamily N-acetyltransferase